MNLTFDRTVAGTCVTTVSGPVAIDSPTAYASPEPALAAGTRLGEFEIIRLIGEGGFGIVYLALDRSLQREVAIKEYLPPSLATRQPGSDRVVARSQKHRETFDAGLRSFLNEARLLARFDHPSLVKVLRFWEGNDTAYMAMPHYRGPTLRRSLLAAGTKPIESDLLVWVHPLLDAIEVLHREQCFHRDIAPDNILLTDRGPVLLDFGAARHVIGDMTQALTVVLKPSFAPLEQYGNLTNGGQGPWTDLYALACVLHFAITGKAPAPSVERVLFDTFVPLSQSAQGQYSAGLLAAIDAALALRPQDRPQDVAAFRGLLRSNPVSGPIDLPLPLADLFDEVPAPILATPVAVSPESTAPTLAMPVVSAPVVRTSSVSALGATTSTGAPPHIAMQPTSRKEVAAVIAKAPAAVSPNRQFVSIGLATAAAIITAVLATGYALHERLRPVPFALPVLAANAPTPLLRAVPDKAQPLSGQPSLPTAPITASGDRAAEAASAPSEKMAPSPVVATLEHIDEAPIRARRSTRSAGRQRAAGSAADFVVLPTATPSPAIVPLVEAEPPTGSRCAEILERASLGAPGADDGAALKKECR